LGRDWGNFSPFVKNFENGSVHFGTLIKFCNLQKVLSIWFSICNFRGIKSSFKLDLASYYMYKSWYPFGLQDFTCGRDPNLNSTGRLVQFFTQGLAVGLYLEESVTSLCESWHPLIIFKRGNLLPIGLQRIVISH